MTDRDPEPLLRAHRTVRALAQGEGPWPGVVTRLPDGTAAVLVDADEVGLDWIGWRAETDGHLLGARDVARTATGHLAIVDLCTDRLEDVVRRRSGAGSPLTAGEAVTVLVSLVRGVRELLGAPTAPTGSWWVTDAGRPVFGASAATGTDIVTAARQICEALGGEAASAAAETAKVLESSRLSKLDLDELEAALFRRAEPTPLMLSSLLPRRSRDLDAVDVAREEVAPGFAASWLRLVDDDFRDLVSRATTGLWRRVRTRGAKRARAPWLVAGAAGAAVLTIGLVWPAGADAGDAEAAPSASAPAADVSARSSTDAPVPESAGETSESPDIVPAAAPVASADLAAAVDALLTARVDCREDRACLAEVLDDPDAVFPRGVIDAPSPQRSVTLLDEFGGAAVLRVDAIDPAHPSQLVVVVEKAGKRLLRDVHDAAQQ